MLKVTLKKDWVGPRRRLYKAGTVFIRNSIVNRSGCPGHWYDFESPDEYSGFVFIPDHMLAPLSPKEKELRRIRGKMREEHMRKTEMFRNRNGECEE